MPYVDEEKQKAAQRRYYEDNKSIVYERTKVRRRICRDYVIEVKDNAECSDCKIQYPHYIMQFDHLRDKVRDISALSRNCSLETLKKEIAKCELVCSNCHFHRTYMRRMTKLGHTK